MAPYSLSMRCTLFHRKFPARRIKLEVLRKILRQAGIKRKVVVTKRVAARKEERVDQFREMTITLASKIEAAVTGPRHLLWIDEAVFTAQGY